MKFRAWTVGDVVFLAAAVILLTLVAACFGPVADSFSAEPSAESVAAVCRIESGSRVIGSGVAVEPRLVLTCDHVVDDRAKVVCDFDGVKITGTVVRRGDQDAGIDLAAVRLDAVAPAFVRTLWHVSPEKGEAAYVVGYPHGRKKTVQPSEVCDVRNVRIGSRDDVPDLRTHPQGIPGQSGGAVFDGENRLIGILHRTAGGKHGVSMTLEAVGDFLDAIDGGENTTKDTKSTKEKAGDCIAPLNEDNGGCPGGKCPAPERDGPVRRALRNLFAADDSPGEALADKQPAAPEPCGVEVAVEVGPGGDVTAEAGDCIAPLSEEEAWPEWVLVLLGVIGSALVFAGTKLTAIVAGKRETTTTAQ